MERSRCPTKRGNQDVPASLKVQTFPFCWIKISHIGKFRILGKKVSLIGFRKVLRKILPAACIQLHNYYLFEKAQFKLSSFIQNSVQQDYLPESYARYLPSYQKCHKNCCTHQVWTVPPFPFIGTFIGNPGNGGKSYPTDKNLLISPIRKITFNRFKSFAIKSFISSPSNSNFQVIILCNLHL